MKAEAFLVEGEHRHPTRSWTFQVDTTELLVEDVHMTTRLDDVLARLHADLVVNGGFFDPKGNPWGSRCRAAS